MDTSKANFLHDITPIPEGKTVGDLLPVFSNVKNYIFAGDPNKVCASCRKPFTNVRKPRKAVRLYPVETKIPISFSLNICGRCLAIYERGGPGRDGFIASVGSFFYGEEATQ